MSSPKLYHIFVVSLIIMTSVLFSSHFHPPALAFHTASTASVTIQTGEGTSDANNQSLPTDGTPNIDASGEAALDSPEDTVETDTSNVGQGLNEREQLERFHIAP
jgi:hypothetical protein